MITIYITGKEGYKKKIPKKLRKSDLVEGINYIEGQHSTNHLLFWIPDVSEFRNFKLGITPKAIFKYRLKFFFTEDQLKPKKTSDGFTSEEIELIQEYKLKYNYE